MTAGPDIAGTRAQVAADHSLVGRDLCAAWSGEVDRWLRGSFAAAVGPDPAGVALVAVGGYGRGELSLQSDIDVVLLHAPRRDVGEIADALWYPVWDAGLKLGHSVRTVTEALRLAADDLATATALLAARHVAGDAGLTADLAHKSELQWHKRARRWLPALGGAVRERHRAAGDVAYALEPDLKEGRGGLRDVQALRWARAARPILWDDDRARLDEAYERILAARVELHRRTGRPGDRLVLEEQAGVADALGLADDDELLRDLAGAARTVAWASDDTWARIDSALAGPGGRRRRDRAIGPSLALRDDEVHVPEGAEIAGDPTLALRAATAAAVRGARLDRRSLDRLAAAAPVPPAPWPAEVRQALVDLLLAGPPALGLLEALDQHGIWERYVPEWPEVRSRPQRNALHRFTVDRHLWEAALRAGQLAGRVARPDLLVLGALLHDIGKGRPGDHTANGVALIAEAGPRMGLDADDTGVLSALCRDHLLLGDVAMRRDVDDPAVAGQVAERLGDRRVLELLAALTEADALATGPAAWTDWRAGLVRRLVRNVGLVLEGGPGEPPAARGADLGEQHGDRTRRDLLAARVPAVVCEGDRLTVVAVDRPGLFSRVAGVLALHGLDVRRAIATSEDGWVVEDFRVESSFGPVFSWDAVRADVDRALAGRLAIRARLAERARTYGGTPRHRGPVPEPEVVVDLDAAPEATVVEVHATDQLGLLYRVTSALADLDLDIVRAQVQSSGARVVDSFYVRAVSGERVTAPHALAEIERAVRHAAGGDAR